ncbi:MAG TPA: hypothetical protein VN442_13040 [Bryobacteraceae bacterium]|nr:hypothetical protein [Bryobacteraceae bacterium]
MAVHKRKRKGKVSWYYKFDAPGSTRDERRIIREFGFATKGEAQGAEAARRIEEQEKAEMAKAGSPIAAAPPKTLAMLLNEFFQQHVDVKLAPKTIERYHEQAVYLDAGLLGMPITEITPLHLNREWKRLLESGGHHRHTKAPRPLSKKTVRNVAGVVSSAFRRAVMWGLAAANPVTNSEPPVPRKCRGTAITVAQVDTLVEAASGPWCISLFLEMAMGLGARRGEVLALRWSDIVNGRAVISRTLSQTKNELKFKPLKGHEDTEERLAGVVQEAPHGVLGRDHLTYQDGVLRHGVEAEGVAQEAAEL